MFRQWPKLLARKRATAYTLSLVHKLPPPPPPDSGIDYEEKRSWKEEAKEIVKGEIEIVMELAE